MHFYYDFLKNICLRNKDGNGKNSQADIIKTVFVWLHFGGNITNRAGLMLSLLKTGFVLLRYQFWQILDCISAVQIRIKCLVDIYGGAIVQELCLMDDWCRVHKVQNFLYEI